MKWNVNHPQPCPSCGGLWRHYEGCVDVPVTEQTEPDANKWHLRQSQGIWSVLETPCYPRSFKVVHSTYRKQSNDFSEFFYTFKEAQVEATKRNGFDYGSFATIQQGSKSKMTKWNNYCPRCARYVFSRRVAKGTPCPRCGQPCVEYGDMKRAELDHMSRELQKARERALKEQS